MQTPGVLWAYPRVICGGFMSLGHLLSQLLTCLKLIINHKVNKVR